MFNVKFYQSMSDKDKMIALAEVKQAIEDFLNDWYSVSDLFETAANAGSTLLRLTAINRIQLPEEEMKFVTNLIDQHVMLANLMKDCEKLLKGNE